MTQLLVDNQTVGGHLKREIAHTITNQQNATTMVSVFLSTAFNKKMPIKVGNPGDCKVFKVMSDKTLRGLFHRIIGAKKAHVKKRTDFLRY